MSLQNSFNKIRRNAGIKKCVMIDGNVGDVYLDDKNQIVDRRPQGPVPKAAYRIGKVR